MNKAVEAGVKPLAKKGLAEPLLSVEEVATITEDAKAVAQEARTASEQANHIARDVEAAEKA